MHAQKSAAQAPSIQANVPIKLAASWASFMFLYIYVDYFALYMPGQIAELQRGIVFEFNITPIFLLIALVSVTIPALMIFLSVVLQFNVSRLANIIVAIIYIPYSLVNLIGVAWVHMFFGAAVEIILLGFIIRYAWRWSPTEA